jgi:amino acid permease
MAKAAPFFAGGDVDTNYTIFACIFAAMVVPMSCMELDEQVVVQVLMTGARFLMLFLMVFTSSMCAKEDVEAGQLAEAQMFRPAGIHKMLPVMVFAHLYHHSIPGLSHPVADKKKLGGIFQSTTVFSTIAYTFIGVILGSAFGSGIEESSNLNWKGFTGGTAILNGDGQIISIAWWAKAISLYVLCFPALDVISAFPLNAITVSCGYY